MPRRPAHVGFTPENGLKSDIAASQSNIKQPTGYHRQNS
jgi:hypothetical protein